MIGYLKIWEFETGCCGDNNDPVIGLNLFTCHHFYQYCQCHTSVRAIEQPCSICPCCSVCKFRLLSLGRQYRQIVSRSDGTMHRNGVSDLNSCCLCRLCRDRAELCEPCLITSVERIRAFCLGASDARQFVNDTEVVHH